EAALLPWSVEIAPDDSDEVAVDLEVRLRRLPFRLRRRITLRSGETRLTFAESATNAAAVPLDAMWGQHLALGRPFWMRGARRRVPDGARILESLEGLTAHAGTVCPLSPGGAALALSPAAGAGAAVLFEPGAFEVELDLPGRVR